GMSHTLISESGKVVVRVDMTLTELVLPPREQNGTFNNSSDSSSGGEGAGVSGNRNGTFKEAPVIRSRSILLMTQLPRAPPPKSPSPPNVSKSSIGSSAASLRTSNSMANTLDTAYGLTSGSKTTNPFSA
ncbi:hypothetical protein VaNZ11_004409, partial [Volvox africanus]